MISPTIPLENSSSSSNNSGVLVTPVEKKGRYSDAYALRFVCFDPRTRCAYLSRSGANISQWKHEMKVYAIEARGIMSNPQFRNSQLDAKDFFAFTLYGVARHNNHGSSKQISSVLPQLLGRTYTEAEPGFGSYEEGSLMCQHSTDAVSSADDTAFLSSKGRLTWELRCRYYSACHDMLMMIRDVLIADGLRVPVHGGIHDRVDPRNGLRFATLSLYLQRPFASLLDKVVYTCCHSEMIGCNPDTGILGVCMRHCYVCITDRDVLFMSEDGTVARWAPLSTLRVLEYNSAGAGSFCAFLSEGTTPDALVAFCSAFAHGDASPSMTAAMPQCEPDADVHPLERVLIALLPKTATAQTEKGVAAADAATAVSTVPSAPREGDAQPYTWSSEANGGGGGALQGLTVTAMPYDVTVKRYVESFASRHGRQFKWQPLPGHKPAVPTVQAARLVAATLTDARSPLPRQDITYREGFLRFYAGSTPACAEQNSMKGSGSQGRLGSSSNSSSSPQRQQQQQQRTLPAAGPRGASAYGISYEEEEEGEVFLPTLPVRRHSNVLQTFRSYAENTAEKF